MVEMWFAVAKWFGFWGWVRTCISILLLHEVTCIMGVIYNAEKR